MCVWMYVCMIVCLSVNEFYCNIFHLFLFVLHSRSQYLSNQSCAISSFLFLVSIFVCLYVLLVLIVLYTVVLFYHHCQVQLVWSLGVDCGYVIVLYYYY